MAKKACKRSSLEIYGGIYFVDDDKILEKKKEATLFLYNLLVIQIASLTYIPS
jgi:hypothetical protein